MNTLSISGTALQHGSKGGKYPKLWIRIALEPIVITVGSKELRIDKNEVFINASYDADPSSPKGSVANRLTTELDKGKKFIFVKDITVGPIKRARKKEDGSWEEFEETGLSVNIKNISLSETRYANINNGHLFGKILRQTNNKLILEDKYRVPKDNTWKSREIPLFIPEPEVPNLVNSYLYTIYKISGNAPTGESKSFCLSLSYIKT